ncbi:MAG TPA: VCBS repeat-containing protein [Planctomycetota bacterium]|nr:VCBS repeat-containing protein [Planctomycetota bacterium]
MSPSCALWACLCTHLLAATPPARPFTNVTQESGVGAVVSAHFQNSPKWWMSGIDLVDLDGDGDLDLHLGSHGGPSAAAAFNDGKGRFTYADPKLTIPRGVRANDAIPYPGGEIRLAFDFDEDGRVDILASWHDGGGVLYRNECTPDAWSFTRPRTLDHFNRACAMADMDRDGIADYLADEGGRANPQIAIYFGKGDGSFPRKQLIPGSYEEGGPVCVDIDGDGDLDMLVARRGYHPPGRRIFLSDGKLSFTNATKEAGLTEEGGSIHGVGDFDADGDLDLICVEGEKAPFKLVIYFNDGKGRFTPKPDAIAGAEKLKPYNTNWGGAVTTDFDNDGLPDILVNGRYFLYLLRGTGGGKFEVANDAWGLPTGAWSAVDEGLCFGDIDADGDLDILACAKGAEGREKGIDVFRNDLPKQHWLRVRPIGKKGNRSAAGAKIRVYEAGGPGDPRKLLWFEQVAIWGRQSFHSYYAAAVAERHFGLGAREAADLAVEFYPSGKRVEAKAVKADSTTDVREEE